MTTMDTARTVLKTEMVAVNGHVNVIHSLQR